MRALWIGAALLVGCGQEYEVNTDPGPLGAGDDLTWPTETGPFDIDGDGQIDGDHFDLSGKNPTDIVIYGDTSTSMSEELTTLGDRVLEFTDRIQEAGASWNLIAVTGATGCGVDGIFTPNTPNFDQRFKAAILTPPENRDLDEMGLQNVRNALAQAAPGGCNEGFLRPNALLHIIYISDENDESPGFEDPDYWVDYVDQMIALKGSAALTRISAVAGPTPTGCPGAEPGFGYDEAVAATGGEFVSICDDWPSELDALADASVITDLFPLSRQPVPESIQPFVNGELRETGWEYDPVENAVRFVSNPPMTGDIVDIFYEPA